MDKIAICITTRNRKEAFDKCIEQMSLFMPDNARLFIVDDASDIPAPDADFRFSFRSGIPVAKNKCIELAMCWGANHIFLFDDDTYPISINWHIPYIDSPYKHLCYTFLESYKSVNGHKYHLLGNGCVMYIHRDVVEAIGGFDLTFGLGKYEHTQFSHRASAAGFCPVPYVDVIGSEKLFYSMDEHGEVERTMTSKEMGEQLKSGRQHFRKTLNDLSFYHYN
ncbi:hypothetical protein OHD16_06660 [Sphingobacterium sp. ML3W]|uniref:glycosyltransferase family 2 protein n=1 Tax=Sphingobacterium sp. ML3W TaxID=1538644 RepID=UPI00249BDA66|nr:hypothetical protein [Sphingobacterium sp. ML3W]WFA79650.1 hypothetical protein OGI71_26900 [Sphingobacterium sp. ML3W]